MKRMTPVLLWIATAVAQAQMPSDMGAPGMDRTIRDCADARGYSNQLTVMDACDALVDMFSTPATGTRLNSSEDLSQLARAHVMRARAWLRFGDLDRAQADFDRAVQLRPRATDFRRARCQFLVAASRNLEQARIDCDQWLAARPSDADARLASGYLRLRTSEFDAAIQQFDAALSTTGAHRAQALYGRGLARLAMGQAVLGDADINNALSIDETAVAEVENLGFTRAQQDQH